MSNLEKLDANSITGYRKQDCDFIIEFEKPDGLLISPPRSLRVMRRKGVYYVEPDASLLLAAVRLQPRFPLEQLFRPALTVNEMRSNKYLETTVWDSHALKVGEILVINFWFRRHCVPAQEKYGTIRAISQVEMET